MALAYVGPVALGEHGNPGFSITSAPLVGGARGVRIEGKAGWTQTKQLSELIANADRRVTVGDYAGVLDYVYAGDDLLRSFNGWYLLESFELAGDQPSSVTGWVGFTIEATLLGERAARIPRSERGLDNDFGLSPLAFVADPFVAEDFLVDPGGTPSTREFDPGPHLETAEGPVDGSGDLALRIGALGDIDSVIRPTIVADGEDPPRWVTDRGGDCRAYDRHEEREVYGPSHPPERTSDLVLTNGIVRCRLGNVGLPPYLNVQAIADGLWREVGVLQFGNGTELIGARLVTLTRDVVSIALAVKDAGEVSLVLNRGERQFRGRVPTLETRPTWRGTPPATRANTGVSWPAKFGNGIDGGGSAATWAAPFPAWSGGDDRFAWSGARRQPDLYLRRPPRLSAQFDAFWYRADRSAADAAGSGFLTIFDESGALVGQLWLDSGDLRIKFAMGAYTVESEPQAFAAGDDLFLAVGYSPTEGIALTVRDADGAVSHARDASAIAPNVGDGYSHTYFVNNTRWGDGEWGDGEWGGVTHYPEGTIDNHMIYARWLLENELEGLASATAAHDAVPSPTGDLVWFAPFDVDPVVFAPASSSGLALEDAEDEWGFTRGVASLDAAGRDFGAFLARDGSFEDAASQQRQLAAKSEQEIRVA